MIHSPFIIVYLTLNCPNLAFRSENIIDSHCFTVTFIITQYLYVSTRKLKFTVHVCFYTLGKLLYSIF